MIWVSGEREREREKADRERVREREKAERENRVREREKERERKIPGTGSFRAFLDKAKGLQPAEISDLMANSRDIGESIESLKFVTD